MAYFGNCKVVFFKVETTGLCHYDQVIQIAACDENSLFNKYILPTIHVSEDAGKINGFFLKNKKLYLKGQYVRTEKAFSGCEQFIDYLKNFDERIVLIAHNAFGLDARMLVNLAKNVGLIGELQEVVVGFSDSLIFLKNYLKPGYNGSCALKSLVMEFLPHLHYNRHAIRDVDFLKKLVDYLGIEEYCLTNFAKNITEFY